MAKQKVKVFDLSKVVDDIIKEYGLDVAEIVAKDVRALAPQVVSKIQEASPKRTGEYARGWKAEVSEQKTYTKAMIFNDTKPYLTHVLENGHAKVGGGRVSARKHIKPTKEWAEEKLWEMVVNDLK